MSSPLPRTSEHSERRAPDQKASFATLSDREFARVAARVERMAGIILEPHKKQMIYSRLSRHLRGTRFAGFAEYLDHLDGTPDDDDLQGFLNVLTTNLTSFFREKHHYAHLEEHVLRPAANRRTERLRIWSAGCSSGEEAFSIAMSMQLVFGEIPADARVLATDLDTRTLEAARKGVYSQDRLSGIAAPYAKLLPKPDADGRVTLPRALRAAVSFKKLNLLERWPMQGRFDAIFCRNVMIYFNTTTKADLVERFTDALVPNGFLYLGHSESILGDHPRLIGCGETVYRRRGNA